MHIQMEDYLKIEQYHQHLYFINQNHLAQLPKLMVKHNQMEDFLNIQLHLSK